MKKLYYYAGYFDLFFTWMQIGFFIISSLGMILNGWNLISNLYLIFNIVVTLLMMNNGSFYLTFREARKSNEYWKKIYDEDYKEEK